MDLRLDNKIALVTGSGRGIGLAIARTLSEEGCCVALNSRNMDKLQEVSSSFSSEPSLHVADVTKPQECDELVRQVINKWGRLDILVCNVGSGRSVPAGTETYEEWNRVIALNLYSATNAVKACQNELSKSNGSIVCISSICGQEALGAPLTYSAAKSALNSYVTGVSRVLAEKGIRINAVAPGNILDEGGTWERKLAEDKQSVEKMLVQEVAQHRLGRPEEVADAVCFLVSARSSFITGTTLTVDGGQVKS